MHLVQPGSGIERRPRPLRAIDQARARTGCVLVPVSQISDIDAALAYALLRPQTSAIRLALLHVTPLPASRSRSSAPDFADRLLDQAAARCRAAAVAHDSHIVAGDLVFSILDAAELLACDAIVMSCPKARPWHRLFDANIVASVTALRRDVPLILIDANGEITRSKL